jgi:assimilatory nitrate reductase catalytic subunit
MPFDPPVSCVVPEDRRALPVYFSARNASPELIYLVLTRGGRPRRYFPVGTRGAIYTPLAVREDIDAGTRVKIAVAAPEAEKASMLPDIGFMEIV